MMHSHLVKFTYLYKDNRTSVGEVTYSSEVNGNVFTVEYSSVRGLALSWLILVREMDDELKVHMALVKLGKI